MQHWILTRDRAQTITENLDRNLMTLSAARDYFSAYGVEINGRTKEGFIQNLWRMVKDSDNRSPRLFN